jgi:hypothetical protein
VVTPGLRCTREWLWRLLIPAGGNQARPGPGVLGVSLTLILGIPISHLHPSYLILLKDAYVQSCTYGWNASPL